MKKLFLLTCLLLVGCEASVETGSEVKNTIPNRFKLLSDECGVFQGGVNYSIYLDTKTGNKYIYFFEVRGFGNQTHGGPIFCLLDEKVNADNLRKYDIKSN